jgi:phage terminase Nu1 subunit (DNA packaging protein)
MSEQNGKPKSRRGDPRPAPLVCERHQLASLAGVHVDRISEYRAAGMPCLYVGGLGGSPDDRRSKYDALQAMQWIRANRRGRLDAMEEKALLDRSRREDVDYRLLIRKGEYVSRRETELAFANVVRAARDRLLSIPSRVKHRMPEISNAGLRLLDELIRGTLEDLAAGLSHAADDLAAPIMPDSAPPTGGSAERASAEHDAGDETSVKALIDSP